MSSIKIGIIDDHQAMSQALALQLSQTGQYETLFVISEKTQVLKTLSTAMPDVLVMDVVMPGSPAIDMFKEVISAYPRLKILAYTALNSPMMVEMLLRTGVKGYVGKSQPLPELQDAILDVYYDRLSLPADYQFILRKLKSKDGPEELSPREIEILILIAAEKTTNEIATLLQISVNTVETHRRHLFGKLNVSNLAGLIKVGFELGYLK